MAVWATKNNKKTAEAEKTMKEQRVGDRRLSFHSGQRFPFQDLWGRIIHDDRRRTPDRRLNNISLELVETTS
jgi:hypothetical protein